MLAIIDYGAGNLTSVRLAFEGLSAAATVTAQPDAVVASDRVILPGVGAAGAAMSRLRELRLVPAIRDVVARGTPFLGICLGAQIVLDRSEEDGGVDCLGLLPGTARIFKPPDRWDKVPQMGWNSVAQRSVPPGSAHPLFQGIDDNSEFYFVHSYYPVPSDPSCVLGETDYGGICFASAVGRRNLAATQFHPEKSGRVGLRLLQNFLSWTP
jgi:glutamine amidotransferase